MINLQVEKWPSFVKDAEPLFTRHWKELSLDQDKIEFSLDHERYLKLDEAGLLFIVSAREGKKVLGYYMAFLGNHPHYKEAGVMAITDVYYIRPECRTGGLGARLFRKAESELKARGVTKIYLSCKLHQNHTELFKRLGYRTTDVMFTKYIGK